LLYSTTKILQKYVTFTNFSEDPAEKRDLCIEKLFQEEIDT